MKSNITQNHEKGDAFSKIGQQLDDVQKTAGKLDLSVAEARTLLSPAQSSILTANMRILMI